MYSTTFSGCFFAYSNRQPENAFQRFPAATHAGAMVKQPEMLAPRLYGLLASRALALKIPKAA